MRREKGSQRGVHRRGIRLPGDRGSHRDSGMELFTLQSTEDVSVEISVSKNDYGKVKEGQKAEITMGSSKYSGTVTKVDKIAIPNEKGTPVIGAKVHIDNPDENIFFGRGGKGFHFGGPDQRYPQSSHRCGQYWK